MQEGRKKLGSKLTPKSTEFVPVPPKPVSDEQVSSVLNALATSNEGHIFANEFTRLDSYTDIKEVRELSSLTQLNSAEYKIDSPAGLGYVVVTSSSADDIHKSMKYGIWASTKDGNATLCKKFVQRKKGQLTDVLIFFRVRDEKHFVGCARLLSNYIEEQQYDLWWERVEWKGLFAVQWIFAKNLPFDSIAGLEPDDMVDGAELNSDLGFQVLKKFVMTPYDYSDSVLQLFCVLDRREDNLISLRSKIAFSKEQRPGNKKHKFG